MNQGAGAGRDDDDLPLVDVVVPDDARELFRDVLAYHRELRALRQRERWRQIVQPIRRRGPILPLASGILLFALIAGVVLSVLSSGPFYSGGRGGTTTAATSVSTKSPAAALPAAALSSDGRSVTLGTLRSAAIALVPAGCGCQSLLERLITQAGQAKVPVYLVGPAGIANELAGLAGAAGPGQVITATDPANALGSAFRPAGLTVLLVGARGAVTIDRRVTSGFALEPALSALSGSG